MLRIFLPLYLLLFVFSFYSNDLFDQLLLMMSPEAIVDDTVNDLSGAFYMVEEVLRLTPPDQWPEKLEKMSSANIPVKLVSSQALELSEPGLTTLEQGGIWIADIEHDIALKAFDTEGRIIQIGPIDTTDMYEDSVFITFFGGSGVLVICVVLWTLTVQRRIRHLAQATQKLGQGELTVRASEAGHLRVSDLNHNFNTMAERIQQLIESHKHLSNAVSHELRTPISRIKFELDYAQDLDDVQELQKSLNSIAEDINELEDLVSEALTYARFERSGLKLDYEPQVLDSWLQQWSQQIKLPHDNITLTLVSGLSDSLGPSSKAAILVQPGPYRAQTHQISQRVQIQTSQVPQSMEVEFHPSSIKRALDNLVLNACRYADYQVQVSFEVLDGSVSILVDDDGPGIPEQDRATLFDPFVRADKSRSKLTGGFGLGLAIVKQIVLRHQGQVEVMDSPLGGARFKLSWPRQQSR
ncbi:ATP-binding protein [Oceanospirillum beijerinckii]|uniref:ATP-binding protein n=1 Tax=Oceanospirillum beijerinckii TaxID=64976 RepID=UPI000417B99E|nr:ATP-binding protein [Oceanospirillum beijerinckii]